MSHSRVVAGLRAQLEDWRKALDGGAKRVGWKIGLNIPEVQEQLGIDEPVIGHLTSATLIESGGWFDGAGTVRLMAEPEVAVEVGRDVPPDADADTAREAVSGLATALELVDTGRPPDEVGEIVAGNVFHRAVVLGPSRPALPAEGARAAIAVGGEEREQAEVPDDFSDVVTLTARLLGEAGEQLAAGDRIIAGSLSPQVPLATGDQVAVEVTGLGRVEARITP